MITIQQLLEEYETALGYTNLLWLDLDADQVSWRPSDESSAIGWHLGHQAAVAHFMVRNLTAAEPPIDRELDALMDSATAERNRGDLPTLDRLGNYRRTAAERVRVRVRAIDEGNVGAPAQLRHIAATMLTAIINHEYQHSKWISEVRSQRFGLLIPPAPASPNLIELDGYTLIG
jgi:hypothetical protein